MFGCLRKWCANPCFDCAKCPMLGQAPIGVGPDGCITFCIPRAFSPDVSGGTATELCGQVRLVFHEALHLCAIGSHRTLDFIAQCATRCWGCPGTFHELPEEILPAPAQRC